MTLLLIAWAFVATIAAIVGWCGAIEANQRADRAEAWAEDCLAMLNKAEERVAYWRNQYHGGVDAIVERLRAAVHEEAPDDAAVLEWLDDATEWTQ